MGVIDAQPGKGRHEVFDGIDLRRPPLQTGAHAGIADGIGIGRQIDDRIEIHTMKDDARIRRSRAQGKSDLVAAMQTNTGRGDNGFQGALLQHDRSPNSSH